MKIFKITFLAMIAAVAVGVSACSNKESLSGEYVCTCPEPTQIYIQPLNNYTEADAKKIAEKLEQVTEEAGIPVYAEILPPVQLGDELKNEGRSRYRADKILDWLKKTPKPVIALINDDISCTYKGVSDWGVLGLSYMGKDVCVVSTYRVANKRNFWKVVYHEFGHAHFGLPHCPADDPTCIMRDAKGHPKLDPQKAICDSCWENKYGKAK